MLPDMAARKKRTAETDHVSPASPGPIADEELAGLRRLPWGGPGPDPRLAGEDEAPAPPEGLPTWPNEVIFRHTKLGDFRAYATDREPVAYGKRAVLPARYTAEPLIRQVRGEPPATEVPVAIDIDASTGEPRCMGVRAVTGEPLTGELLRKVPIEGLTQQATWAMARPASPVRVAPDVWSFELIEETALAQANAAESGPGSRTPRARLEDVAEIYLQAKANGKPPVIAVADELPASRPHAGKLVMYARRIGLIPPAPVRRT